MSHCAKCSCVKAGCEKCHCTQLENRIGTLENNELSDEEVILENNELYKYLKEQNMNNLMTEIDQSDTKFSNDCDKFCDSDASRSWVPFKSLFTIKKSLTDWMFKKSRQKNSALNSGRTVKENEKPWIVQNDKKHLKNANTTSDSFQLNGNVPSCNASNALNICPEYIYFIQTLTNSKLILKDDLHILDHFLPNNEKYKILSQKHSNRAIIVPGVLVLTIYGLNKYCFNNNSRYVLPCVGVSVSSYFLLHKLYNAYQLTKLKKDLHKFVHTIQNYSNAIHKNIQFLNDFENMSRNVVRATGTPRSQLKRDPNNNAWCKLPHLRYNLLCSLNEMCRVLYEDIRTLFRAFPFNDRFDSYVKQGVSWLEFDELGIGNVDADQIDDISIKTLMKSKYIFFLLVSELLSLLVLCFCPYTLCATPNDKPHKNVSHKKHVDLIFKLVAKLSTLYADQYNHLEQLFNVQTIHKTQDYHHHHHQSTFVAVASEKKNAKYGHLLKRIRTIETCLLFVLSQYKTMETHLTNWNESECINDNVVLNDLRETHTSVERHPLRALLYNVECFNVELGRARRCSSDDDGVEDKGVRGETSLDGVHVTDADECKNVMVGYTDFSIKQNSDEIFLGIAGVASASDSLTLDEEHVNYYEFEKQFSCNVLTELKEKLKEKQAEWKRREKMALEVKNMNDFSENEDYATPIVPKIDVNDAHRKRRKRKSLSKNAAIESLSDTDDMNVNSQNVCAGMKAAIAEQKHKLSLPSTTVTESNNASTTDTIKYRRLYNLSRSQESYENRETSPSSDDEDDETKKNDLARLNEKLAMSLFGRQNGSVGGGRGAGTSSCSLASQIERVSKEWNYASVEEEFGDKVDDEGKDDEERGKLKVCEKI